MAVAQILKMSDLIEKTPDFLRDGILANILKPENQYQVLLVCFTIKCNKLSMSSTSFESEF